MKYQDLSLNKRMHGQYVKNAYFETGVEEYANNKMTGMQTTKCRSDGELKSPHRALGQIHIQHLEIFSHNFCVSNFYN